ncbi:MAG: hypothetical protein ABJJ48_10645, partial [Marinomonas sp.]
FMSKANLTESRLQIAAKASKGTKLREHARVRYEQAQSIAHAQQEHWDDNGATPAQMMRIVERQRAQMQEQRRELKARFGSIKLRAN